MMVGKYTIGHYTEQKKYSIVCTSSKFVYGVKSKGFDYKTNILNRPI